MEKMYYDGHDMIGRRLVLPSAPKRIVSLVPSQTELLFDLGLEEEVIGITKFCVHPHEWFRTKKRVGGTKTVNIDAVLSLKPDLIIANKEENVRDQIDALSLQVPVWISDINDIDSAMTMIGTVALLTNRVEKGDAIISSIRKGQESLRDSHEKKRTVAYYIWRDPWMCAGSDTFINDMIKQMGWQNIVDTNRYPVVPPQALSEQHVELVLLSSEPYPFKEKHIAEIKFMLPEAHVVLVDGEMFSWYGSRLVHAMGYLQMLRNELK